MISIIMKPIANVIHNTYVVPKTTSPWIWPSNGQILRGTFQNFWIPILLEVFRHVYMTNCSYFYFQWLKVWSYVIFHWCFDYDDWWLIFPILFFIPWVNWWLNLITLNSFWLYVHCWTHLSYDAPLRSLLSGLHLPNLFTLPMTLFTLRRVVIFYLSNNIIFMHIVS